MLRCTDFKVVTDLSNDYSSLIYRIKQPKLLNLEREGNRLKRMSVNIYHPTRFESAGTLGQPPESRCKNIN
jgi:hypothetical protein